MQFCLEPVLRSLWLICGLLVGVQLMGSAPLVAHSMQWAQGRVLQCAEDAGVLITSGRTEYWFCRMGLPGVGELRVMLLLLCVMLARLRAPFEWCKLFCKHAYCCLAAVNSAVCGTACLLWKTLDKRWRRKAPKRDVQTPQILDVASVADSVLSVGCAAPTGQTLDLLVNALMCYYSANVDELSAMISKILPADRLRVVNGAVCYLRTCQNRVQLSIVMAKDILTVVLACLDVSDYWLTQLPDFDPTDYYTFLGIQLAMHVECQVRGGRCTVQRLLKSLYAHAPDRFMEHSKLGKLRIPVAFYGEGLQEAKSAAKGGKRKMRFWTISGGSTEEQLEKRRREDQLLTDPDLEALWAVAYTSAIYGEDRNLSWHGVALENPTMDTGDERAKAAYADRVVEEYVSSRGKAKFNQFNYRSEPHIVHLEMDMDEEVFSELDDQFLKSAQDQFASWADEMDDYDRRRKGKHTQESATSKTIAQKSDADASSTLPLVDFDRMVSKHFATTSSVVADKVARVVVANGELRPYAAVDDLDKIFAEHVVQVREAEQRMQSVRAQIRTRKKKNKAPVVEEQEALVAGSKPINHASVVLVFGRRVDDAAEVEIGLGYIAQVGKTYYAVTHRHMSPEVDSLETNDDFDTFRVLSQSFDTGHLQKKAMPRRYVNGSSDMLMLQLNVTEGVIPARVASKLPAVGEPITIATLALVDGKLLTSSTIGQVKFVDQGSGVVGYNASTARGYCRAPVFNRGGEVLGGHRWASYSCREASFPAAELDTRQAANGGRQAVFLTTLFDKPPQTVAAIGEQQVLQRATRPVVEMCPCSKPAGVVDDPIAWQVYDFDEVERCLFLLKHLVVKPGADAVVREVMQFDEGALLDPELVKPFRQSLLLQNFYDGNCSTVYVNSNEPDALVRMMSCVESLEMRSKAGACFPDHDTRFVIEQIGVELGIPGVQAVATVALRLIAKLEAGEVFDDPYLVFGKRDKYTLKKLEKGRFRSIQAASLWTKLAWLWCFRDSDALWSMQAGEPKRTLDAKVWTGLNCFLPVDSVRRSAYLRASMVFATDATDWDKHLTADIMCFCFNDYFRQQCRGIPDGLLEFFRRNAVETLLACPDGVLRQKFSGNPSGFPNTLRLNSVCNAALSHLAHAFVLRKRTGSDWGQALLDVPRHVFYEVVGDDNRSWCYGELGDDDYVNEYLDFWRTELPWEIKLEGVYKFTPGDHAQQMMFAPAFAGLRLVKYRDALVYAMAETHRTAARILQSEPDCSPELRQERIDGVSQALCVNALLHFTGVLPDCTMVGLIRRFPNDFSLSKVRVLLSSLRSESADYASRRDALVREGVEANPGPCSCENDCEDPVACYQRAAKAAVEEYKRRMRCAAAQKPAWKSGLREGTKDSCYYCLRYACHGGDPCRDHMLW